MVKELYKEYQYERTDSSLEVHIPLYQKRKLSELEYLFTWYTTTKVNKEDSIVSIIPWQIHLAPGQIQEAFDVTYIEVPSRSVYIFTKAESKKLLEKIDLLLNPEGFYK